MPERTHESVIENIPDELREALRRVEKLARSSIPSRQRHETSMSPDEWRALTRTLPPALDRPGRRAETTPGEEVLPDAAEVDPWALQGAPPPASAPDASGEEQKPVLRLLEQLLRTADKILARLAHGSGAQNPFDFLP